MELDSLPDDALLQVLRYLDVRELLECRGVCRRWRELALRPLLWRDKRIHSNMSTKLIAIALRLVPRLHSLRIDLPLHGDACDVLLVTRTAISEVDLDFGAKDDLLVALILSRQVSLGRLKKVRFTRHDIIRTSKRERGLRALLLQICQAPGLQSLSLCLNVDLDDEEDLDVIKAMVPVPASLKQLSCAGSLKPYMELLMEWHANTLEVVSLHLYNEMPRTGLASLLAAMPRLRKLTYPMLPDMQLLRQCRSLTHLELSFIDFDDKEVVEAGVPGARLLLCSAAAHLEHLEIIYEPYSSPDVVDLLLSIGRRSGVTALRSLWLRIHQWDWEFRGSESFDEDESESPPPQLVPLAAILPRLPLLTRLDIDSEASDAFLDALDGQVVPKLERLDIRMPRDGDCDHSWLHVEEERMRRVMKRYPRLHVFIKDVDKTICREGDCGFCKSNSCHADMPDGRPCLLRSHRGTGCGVSHVHYTYSPDLSGFEIYIDTSIVDNVAS